MGYTLTIRVVKFNADVMSFVPADVTSKIFIG